MKTLIRGAAILSMDARLGDLPRGDLLIDGQRIAAVAPKIDVAENVRIVEAEGLLAMPGFVNAHIHLWQAPLRGVAGDWTLTEYLRAMHAGLAGYFTPDDIRIANHHGALCQIAYGTTTIADWCHNNPTPDHSDAAIDGLLAAGIRAVFLHGSPKPDPKPGQKHFSEQPMPVGEVRRLRQGRLSSDDALVTMGLAILGPQLSLWEVCDADLRLARELRMIASMHVSGALLTVDGFEKLSEARLLGPHVNIVHGNVLEGERLARLVGEGVTFTPTPEVELQMGFGEPLTSRLRALGGGISLGSDIESAMAGDMFSVTRFALQAARHADNLAVRATGAVPKTMTVTTREALEWATLGGARMLGMEDRIGSLTPGKQADIVLLDTRSPTFSPMHDPAASIVFHASHGNVDTVYIAGKPRKSAGRLVDPLDARAMQALADTGRRIFADFRREQGCTRHPI